MEKFKFVVILLVLQFFSECFSKEAANFCETNARFRRDVPYIISVGDCDASKIKILRADAIEDGKEKEEEEDLVQAPSSVEDVAERVMQGRQSAYSLLTKVLTHFQARANEAVERARTMMEERKRMSESRSKRNLFFKNLLRKPY